LFRVTTAIVCLLASGSAFGQSLTEADAVARGLAQADVREMLAARLDIARGNVEAAGRWANPEVEFSQESLDLPGGESEENFLWIRQRLNVAGVHGLERDAAERMKVAETARTEFAEREIVRDIRRLFYAALAAEQESQTINVWRNRLKELTGAVERRVAAGDASRYDYLRLARELALIRGRAFDLEAAAESGRDRLFSLIGGDPAKLGGMLLPPPADGEAAADIAAGHPLLNALDAEASSAALSAKAAAREAWPELTVGVGRRELDEPGRDADGNLVMLGVEVPIFDRGDGKQYAAESRGRRLRAERALAANRLAADARNVLREIRARRDAALLLQPGDGDPYSLSGIAERAYAEGEIGVMELIDAHRADLAAQREAIARAHAARESYIELQMLRGDQ
jgi:outer membrane protein, heavy metal efflux system